MRTPARKASTIATVGATSEAAGKVDRASNSKARSYEDSITAVASEIVSKFAQRIENTRKQVDELISTQKKSIEASTLELERSIRAIELLLEETEARVAATNKRRAKPAETPANISDSAAKRAGKRPAVASNSRRSSGVVPAKLTSDSVKKMLFKAGIEYRDNRIEKGGFWVLATEREFSAIARELRDRGIECIHKPAGSRKREARSSWQIDVTKALAD